MCSYRSRSVIGLARGDAGGEDDGAGGAGTAAVLVVGRDGEGGEPVVRPRGRGNCAPNRVRASSAVSTPTCAAYSIMTCGRGRHCGSFASASMTWVIVTQHPLRSSGERPAL